MFISSCIETYFNFSSTNSSKISETEFLCHILANLVRSVELFEYTENDARTMLTSNHNLIKFITTNKGIGLKVSALLVV